MILNHAKLLDCTLRDGAYLIDKKFGDANIYGIIGGLLKARVDIIEIGFFQDDGFGEGKTVFLNSNEAKRFIPADKQGTMFTALADYSRYNVKNLDICDGTSIDAVRECFFKKERYDAIEYCRVIKENGYKCFVQPVDILGYSDTELIDFINRVNEIEPYCFSIVDTFGSMYQEDLHRVFEIINHNLVSTCKIGFHSHNNMQLSNSLSQEFVRMTHGKREVIIDGTISGMGRGAGNTPTELIAQYMVSQLGYNYDIDALLDIIDDYMDNIRARCTWGYSTSFFVAGCYSAHVNNIMYLMKKNSIRSKDIRFILNKIGAISRKRYDYDMLEKTYMDYLSSDINDSNSIKRLGDAITNKNVLIMAPGASVTAESKKVKEYITDQNPVIISVNFVPDIVNVDYIYMSNTRRYNYWKNNDIYNSKKRILTSNLKNHPDDENEIVFSFNKLIKCGWDHIDNSSLMLLRLLDNYSLEGIAIAGLDGYNYENQKNYADDELEIQNVREDPKALNEEIQSMIDDFRVTRKHNYWIDFITTSRFDKEGDTQMKKNGGRYMHTNM